MKRSATRKMLMSSATIAFFVMAAVLPALALEGDNKCSPALDGCEELEVHTQSHKTVTDYADTWTNNFDNQNIRAQICNEHHNVFGWQTDACRNSGTVFAFIVSQPDSFTCGNGTIYKYYSDHWVKGKSLGRIDGTQWKASGCS